MGYKFTIDMRNTKHIYVPLRTYLLKEQEEHDNQVEEIVQKHIIARTRSLLSAPVLLVKKNDNSYRVVVDYRKLNEKTENDNFPLTTPRSTSGALCSVRCYSSLDLASGYWQEESTRMMFQKHHSTQEKGTFAYLRMSMGLKGGLSSFPKVHDRDFCGSHEPRSFGLYQ